MTYSEQIMEEHTKTLDNLNTELESGILDDDEYNEMRKQKQCLLDKMGKLAIEIDKMNCRNNSEKSIKGKGEAILEWAKVLVPVIIPIIAYDIFQRRVLKFEEDGSICSSAGRQLHLPKFFK